ncbi:universal stress protein [Oceaniglobus indicus]|uniref:universal stress protein n=1 Tax=Oceaniglobus indicus TaxID=2047749 RepID=UPI000C188E4C|nr:universal stress protein [Oceaniglobus indicus]
MFTTILVAFDGSDQSQTALRTACDVTLKYGAALHVVHVPEPHAETLVVGAAYATIPETEEHLMERAKPVIEKARALAVEAGVEPASAEILRGYPADAILDHARENDIDLIVSGRRGMGRLKGLMLGSVSQKLAALAPCAVLTVGQKGKAAGA